MSGVPTGRRFFYGGVADPGASIARQIRAANAGSFARRTAVDSTWVAVTPMEFSIESRRCARSAGSAGDTGSLRSSIIVRTNVESLMSAKTRSDRQAMPAMSVVSAMKAIRRVTGVQPIEHYRAQQGRNR